MGTERHQVERTDGQESENQRHLLERFAKSIDLVHWIDKPNQLDNVSHVLQHVFEVLCDHTFGDRVHRFGSSGKRCLLLCQKVHWIHLSIKCVLLDFVQVVQHCVVQCFQTVQVLRAFTTCCKVHLSGDEFPEQLVLTNSLNASQHVSCKPWREILDQLVVQLTMCAVQAFEVAVDLPLKLHHYILE